MTGKDARTECKYPSCKNLAKDSYSEFCLHHEKFVMEIDYIIHRYIKQNILEK